jgi:spore cortex biosynthesis protein YabQ
LISIDNQVIVFLYSIIGGIVIAFIYDVFRIKRKKIKSRAFITYLEDFAYWIIVAVVMFTSVYISNDGEIRSYIFLGTIIGLIIYILFLSKIVVMILMALIELLTKIFKTLWKIATLPFYIIYKILRFPISYLFGILRKIFVKTRRISKMRLSILVVRRRIFKNSRKKI